MGEGTVRITRHYGPPRGNSVILVTYKKQSLYSKVKLLKAEIQYLPIYDDDYDNDVL
jgi:hypothetical protein